LFFISIVQLREWLQYIANMLPYHYTVVRITIFYFWMIYVLGREKPN